MARYSGKIGFSETRDIGDGIYEEDIIEKPYRGDVLRYIFRQETSQEKLLDDVKVSNEISIIADSYAMNNSHRMKYVTFIGARWKIASIDVQYPYLNLTLGGVYNGPIPKPSPDPESAQSDETGASQGAP